MPENDISLRLDREVPLLRQALAIEPPVLAGGETIQIVLVREVQDYTILRTEETRELNTVWTPASAGSTEEVERVAFLASKQKAAESRELEALLRTWNVQAGRQSTDCFLKSTLCMACPRCVLFGATDVSESQNKGANIKHRIAYGTAFSLLAVDPNLRETHTFNGVDGATQLTDQTLGDRESVRPGSLFASIVTLRSVTELEFVLALKAILSCTRYGAETRIGGFVRNHVVGLVAGCEEVLSPLELTLAAAQSGADPTIENAYGILEEYRKKAASPTRNHVLSADETRQVLCAVQAIEVDKAFLDKAYSMAEGFRQKQASYSKKAPKKRAPRSG